MPGKETDPREVGRELSVGYLLTGTVQAAANRLRVSVQLVRARDGSPVWGSAYDLARRNLLTLQDSIAERVSASLAVRLTADEQERLYRRYTANPAAYEWFLRGRAQLARVSEDGTRAALQAFERALALDSNYALAQAGLAMASADMHLRFASGPEVKAWGERAKKEASRALALDPSLAEAHLAKAAVSRKSDFDWEGTLEESGRALALNPNLDVAHYFREAAFYHLGLFDLADQEDRDALGLDPANQVEQLRSRGVVAFLSGRYPEAIRNLELARRSSSRAYTDSYLAQAYYYNGDSTRAIATLDSLSHTTSAPAANRARAVLASFLAHSGEQEEAEALIGMVLGKGGYVDHHVAYSLGAAYAQLGQPEQAAAWLAKAVETGFPCYPWFQRDPLLDPVRRDPRVNRVLTQLRESLGSRTGAPFVAQRHDRVQPAARRAGQMPKKRPTAALKAKAIATDIGEMRVFHCITFASRIAVPMPSRMPITPPSRQSTRASIRNCSMMLSRVALRAPCACRSRGCAR